MFNQAYTAIHTPGAVAVVVIVIVVSTTISANSGNQTNSMVAKREVASLTIIIVAVTTATAPITATSPPTLITATATTTIASHVRGGSSSRTNRWWLWRACSGGQTLAQGERAANVNPCMLEQYGKPSSNSNPHVGSPAIQRCQPPLAAAAAAAATTTAAAASAGVAARPRTQEMLATDILNHTTTGHNPRAAAADAATASFSVAVGTVGSWVSGDTITTTAGTFAYGAATPAAAAAFCVCCCRETA